jgi:hypothetical protein
VPGGLAGAAGERQGFGEQRLPGRLDPLLIPRGVSVEQRAEIVDCRLEIVLREP